MLFGACIYNAGKEKLARSLKFVRVITDLPALPHVPFSALFLIEDDCLPEGDFQTHGLDRAISLYL